MPSEVPNRSIEHIHELLRPNPDNIVGHGFEGERPSDRHRLFASSHAPLVAALLHLYRVESQCGHEGFVGQQNIMRGQHALNSADTAHDREKRKL